MIRIVRPGEPDALEAVRVTGIQAARAAIRAGAKPDLTGYEIVKTELAEMQHGKCCYCEKREEQAKYRDIEHYRPKSTYWWLAWTWENLLFACMDCNRELKRDQFPLSSNSKPLVAEQDPPGNEQPLVLDPTDAAHDPAAEIEFRRDKVHGRERWRPYGLTERGRRTIEVCGLDRPTLLTLYRDHVNDHMREKVEKVHAAHRDANTQAVVKAWDTARRSLLAPARPFRALSYDALRVLVSPELRERYRLDLQRLAP